MIDPITSSMKAFSYFNEIFKAGIKKPRIRYLGVKENFLRNTKVKLLQKIYDVHFIICIYNAIFQMTVYFY